MKRWSCGLCTAHGFGGYAGLVEHLGLWHPEVGR